MKQLLYLLFLVIYVNNLRGQLPLDSLKIVDYHVHVFSERLLRNLESQGYDLKKGGFQILEKDYRNYSDIERIIQQNNGAKMLLITAGYGFKDSTGLIREEEIVREENDMLRQMVLKYPEQLIGFFGINPLKSYAIEEIKRCVGELGLHGIKLHLQGNRVKLEDKEHLSKLMPIMKLASNENIPILIHNNAWNLNSGREYANLFIDSILNEIDSSTIIFAHTGGPGLYFNFTHDFLSVFRDYFQNRGDALNHKIFFEISGTILIKGYPGEKPIRDLEKLILEIGEDRFLFGSDYPYRNSEAYLKEIFSKLDLDEKILKRIIEHDIFDDLRK